MEQLPNLHAKTVGVSNIGMPLFLLALLISVLEMVTDCAFCIYFVGDDQA